MVLIKRMPLVLAVFAFVALAATSAMAATPMWQECASNAKGNYEDTKCTKAKTNGGNAWIEVTETKEVKSTTTKGTMEIIDTGTGGPTVRGCSVSMKGWIARSGADGIYNVEFVGCEIASGGSCEGAEAKVAPVNLPWSTTLEEEGSRNIRDKIRSSSGEPGYIIECKKSKEFKEDDKCVGVTSTSMTSKEGIVEASFDAKSEKTKCKFGSGEIKKGTLAIKGTPNSNPLGIRVQSAFIEWFVERHQLAGSEAILARSVLGKLVKLKAGRIQIECTSTTIGAGSIYSAQLEVGNITLEGCTSPFPTGEEKCKIEGGKITLKNQNSQLYWRSETGEEAVLRFYSAGGKVAGVIAEFNVEKEGPECELAGKFKTYGEFIVELKNSTTEEKVKHYIQCPTRLETYWIGEIPLSRVAFSLSKRLEIEGPGVAPESAELCFIENEFELTGPSKEDTFSVKGV